MITLSSMFLNIFQKAFFHELNAFCIVQNYTCQKVPVSRGEDDSKQIINGAS
jgi:hypothetical protein